MSCLHILNRSPAAGLLSTAREIMSPGDALLLLEDGVFHLRQPGELAALPEGVAIGFLAEDLRARGLGNDLPAGVESLDMDDFVDLCARHDKTLSWF